jgi:hypothetical protein
MAYFQSELCNSLFLVEPAVVARRLWSIRGKNVLTVSRY